MTVDRSPLAAFSDRFAQASDEPARICLREVPFLVQLTLRATPGPGLPTVPNTTLSQSDAEVLWMGPDEWLIVAGQRPALERASFGEHASLVDVSAQRTVIELSGAHARDVLLKGCSLDLHPRAFPPGHCAQTMLARSQVIVLAREPDPRYWVFARASFAEYVADWLLDAATEY